MVGRTMKAAVLRQVGEPLGIETVAIDEPGPHEVLIRTVAAGVCHSDLHFMQGSFPARLPSVMGHESAGIVEAVGDQVSTVKVGDHVITCLSIYCGHCSDCLTGRMAICVSADARRPRGAAPRLASDGALVGQLFNLGSFAEFMLVHENACVSIRKDMPLDRAALIGCSVLTGVGAVIHTSGVRPGETVAIIGCGGVGLSAINGADIAGAGRIIAIDTQAEKLDLARRFGATDVIDASQADPVKAVIALTGDGVSHSFEAVGRKETAEQSFRMLRRGGTANIIGMLADGVTIELSGIDFLAERRMQGSAMGSNRFPVDMPRLIDFYLSGKLKLDELIARRIKLEDVNDAFDDMKTGKVARSVIIFD